MTLAVANNAQLILIAPLLYFVTPRVPLSAAQHPNWSNITSGFGFLRLKTFWVLQIANIVQGLGYFIPTLYLPRPYFSSTYDSSEYR